MTTSGSPTGTDKYQLTMFVLDVLRHDAVEQVSSILKLLNDPGPIGWRDFWPHDFSTQEVVPALQDLMRNGHVQAFREDGGAGELQPLAVEQAEVATDYSALWFGLTEKGRELWNGWDPPTSEADG